MTNLYTTYDGSDYAEPPLDVYEENLKRLILLSNAAYTEVGVERGITLNPIPAKDITTGTVQTNNARGISIEAVSGQEENTPIPVNIEIIQINIIIRSGTNGTIEEQIKRAKADLAVIKRITRKIFADNYINDLTLGWPANGDERYTPPFIPVCSLEQFPVAQSKEKEYGYSGGIRITMKAQYFPIL